MGLIFVARPGGIVSAHLTDSMDEGRLTRDTRFQSFFNGPLFPANLDR